MEKKKLGMEDGDNAGQPEQETVRRAAETFWNYLNIHDEPHSADVIFVLGGSKIEPVKKAADLYRAGFAPKIAFISSGGKFGGEAVWGVSEVEKYKSILHELDIPDSALVFEGDPEKQTRNTLQEAKRAIEFLEDRGVHSQKIILVARPLHQRRAFSTFLKQHPGIQYINCPADEPFNFDDQEQVTRLVQEAERLLDYGVRKDDIERPEIPPELLRDAATVRKYLKKQGVYEGRQKPPLSKSS